MANNEDDFVGDFVNEHDEIDDTSEEEEVTEAEDASSEEETEDPVDDSKIKNTNVWLLKNKDNNLDEDGSLSRRERRR